MTDKIELKISAKFVTSNVSTSSKLFLQIRTPGIGYNIFEWYSINSDGFLEKSITNIPDLSTYYVRLLVLDGGNMFYGSSVECSKSDLENSTKTITLPYPDK